MESIKVLRGHLSQRELADKIGVTRSALANYETGRTKPSDEVMLAIMKVATETRSQPKHEGLPVAGYRPQDGTAVQKVNTNKEAEERVLRILDDLAADPEVDKRWLAIGRTHIEQGFMAVNRAVFKPGRVVLPEDGD